MGSLEDMARILAALASTPMILSKIYRKRLPVQANPESDIRIARAAGVALSLGMAILLQACAPMPVRPGNAENDAAQQARETALAQQPAWSFAGRVAVSQGSNGGSGRIEWRQNGADFDIKLSAPITRQSWHLSRQDGLVTLAGLEGGIRQGEDAEALLAAATGWRIPVAAMAAWVRGARAAGPGEVSFGPEGLPASIEQQGWAVEYRSWNSASPPLPLKVFARQDQASVRLVIEAWDAP